MKTIFRITLLIAAVVMVGVTAAQAQRVLKGTVYMDGKPAAGITVEAHKGGNMMTSFDGKYEVEASEKTKYIRFTFIDDAKKLDIEGKSGDVFDYAFTGEIPSGDASVSEESGDVVLKTAQQLVQEDDQNFKNEYSLFKEFYKQGDYESAMPHWKILYNKYPKSTPNLYVNGAKMYESMMQKATTDAQSDEILDDFMKLYDKRVKYFGQKGYVLGRKSTTWLKHKLNSNRENVPTGDELKAVHKSSYEWLAESIKEQGAKTEPPVLVLYMRSTVALFKLGELSKEQVVTNYETCNSVAAEIIKANENEENVKMTQEQVIPYVEKAFGISGAADCEALVNIYAPQFKEKGDDIDFIKKMLLRLGHADCDKSELFAQATERLYELDPSPLAAYNMARRYIRKGEIDKAKEYYRKAMEQETDQDLLATYYLQYAKVMFSESKLSEARNYARKVLAIQSDNCEALMLIGDIYVAGSRSFSGKGIEKSAIFWVACDYYNKARRYEDCSIDAASKASKYRKYFPNKEEAFMEGLQKGTSYTVGGWINETTKVRF